MAWISVAGVAIVVLAAARLAVARAGWRWFLAGAAGWLAAQGAKYVVLLPFLARAGPGGVSVLTASGWFALGAALLAGVTEELGKYVPLRWMRVPGRDAALALGLGAGALEALLVLVSLVTAAATIVSNPAGLGGSLLPVWERTWAVATHAGLATVDAIAVVRRQFRWLLGGMALHTLSDLGAGWYQHLSAVGAPLGRIQAVLYGEEALIAVVAVGVWWLGRVLWRPVRATAAPAPDGHPLGTS